MKLKIILIAINALLIVALIVSIFDPNKIDMSIKATLIFFIIFAASMNVFGLVFYWIMENINQRFEKRAAEKFSIYHWLGNPENPITLKAELSGIKEFKPEKFKDNCEIVKKEINKELKELEDLKSYKKFLILKNDSPRLTSLLSSLKTILIAIITASILTFLNLAEFSFMAFMSSYFFLVISGITLLASIDYMSKAIDRHKLLLILISECIEDKERELTLN